MVSMPCDINANECQCSVAETMLRRSGIESEVVRQNNIIPDDPYSSPDEDGQSPGIARERSYVNVESYARSRAPGTPPQRTPDSVLNPLSIYRLARKSVPERHAPETTSSSVNCTEQQVVQDAGIINQAYLNDLQTLLMSDLSWEWQPADTAVGSEIDAACLLLWTGVPNSNTDSWLPTFPFG